MLKHQRAECDGAWAVGPIAGAVGCLALAGPPIPTTRRLMRPASHGLLRHRPLRRHLPPGGRHHRVVIWFVGAALLHDLVLRPAYSLFDRAAQFLLRGRTTEPGSLPRLSVNHLRAPAFCLHRPVRRRLPGPLAPQHRSPVHRLGDRLARADLATHAAGTRGGPGSGAGPQNGEVTLAQEAGPLLDGGPAAEPAVPDQAWVPTVAGEDRADRTSAGVDRDPAPLVHLASCGFHE